MTPMTRDEGDYHRLAYSKTLSLTDLQNSDPEGLILLILSSGSL